MLRIEAGLVFAGYDFCDQTDPFEAGIGFTVPKDKPDASIGSEAVARRRDNPHKRMVGLDVTGNEPVGHDVPGGEDGRAPSDQVGDAAPVARALQDLVGDDGDGLRVIQPEAARAALSRQFRRREDGQPFEFGRCQQHW